MAFNDFMGKIKDTLDTVVDKTKDIADVVADKAKDTTRIAKLNLEIGSEKDTIKKAYIEIGKIYYENHKDNPDTFFAQICGEIDMAMARIKEKEDEIAMLKETLSADGSIDVEFENVVAESEAEDAPCCEEAPAEEKAEEPCCCEEAPAEEEKAE